MLRWVLLWFMASWSAAMATPTLSGHYSIIVVVTCQATPAFQTGQIFSKLLDANYDPGAGTLAVADSYQIAGSLMSATTPGGLARTPLSYTSPYLNTDDELTAAGVTWKIKYGPLDPSGVALFYVTQGFYAVGGVNLCQGIGIAIRQ